tara:strand:+ start:76282 stop:77103 length:822 start_codon:yes stop_codon:yes gene_type:complete
MGNPSMTQSQIKKIFLLPFFASLLLLPSLAQAQVGVAVDPFAVEEDDLNIGGDIFSDFNEDIESAQIAEDERFYRYGRFFSFQIGLGVTTFDGNRGAAYEDNPPTYNIGINYFMDFRNSFAMGFEYSKHNFVLEDETFGFQGQGAVGLVDVSMLRIYFAPRYYIDTADLGTAITYSNPYLTARLEYWYVNNKFRDQDGVVPDDSGGGLGVGLGGGFEFPIKIKESYLGVEVLWHSVSFHDKFTQNYRSVNGGQGYDDLSGNAYSVIVSYVINW